MLQDYTSEFMKLDNLAAKCSARENNGKPAEPYVYDNSAKLILIRYAEELACAALEGARILAEHRGSKVITQNDMQLYLGEFDYLICIR